MLREQRLDLAQLDAKASNLHLIISPSEKLDVSISKVTPSITCLVKAVISVLRKRIGDELLRRQRVVHVSACKVWSAHVNLANLSDAR